MGLRGRLIILVVGIFLLPPLTIGLFVALGQNLLPGFTDSLVNPVPYIQRLMVKEIEPAINSHDYSHVEKLLRPNVLVLLDDQGDLVYANPQLNIASTQDLRQRVLTPQAGDFQAFFFKHADRNWHAFLFRPSTTISTGSGEYFPIVPVIGAATLLAFVLLMSLLILRGINGSITRLDRVTRQIADGNLDSELKVKGHDYLASLARSMETMRLRLKEEYARRDRFIMAVSHDLKTPIAVIDGYLDAFAEGFADTPDKQREYLGIIRAKTAILSHRIMNLIEIARMATTEWRQTLVETDAAQWLGETLAVFQDEAANQGRRLELKIDWPPQIVVAFNHDMFRRVIENLLSNAWNYSPPGSPVTVAAWWYAGILVLAVQNSGEGIKDGQQKLIFEPFFRGDPGRNAEGFGLGLASVKSIVEMHGWTISVDSVPGQNTSFVLRIPWKRDQSPPA